MFEPEFVETCSPVLARAIDLLRRYEQKRNDVASTNWNDRTKIVWRDSVTVQELFHRYVISCIFLKNSSLIGKTTTCVVLYSSPHDLQKATGMNENELNALCHEINKRVLQNSYATNILKLSNIERGSSKGLLFGDAILDEVLRGVRPKIITEVAGETRSY